MYYAITSKLRKEVQLKILTPIAQERRYLHAKAECPAKYYHTCNPHWFVNLSVDAIMGNHYISKKKKNVNVNVKKS